MSEDKTDRYEIEIDPEEAEQYDLLKVLKWADDEGLLPRLQETLDCFDAFHQISIQDTLQDLPTDQIFQKIKEVDQLFSDIEDDWDDVKERHLEVTAEFSKRAETAFKQSYLRWLELTLSARRLDPAVDAHYRQGHKIVRVEAPVPPPPPSLLRLREGEDPKIAASSEGETERDLTYADMQDWPFGPQLDVLSHAFPLETSGAYDLIQDACDADASLRSAVSYLTRIDEIKAGRKHRLLL